LVAAYFQHSMQNDGINPVMDVMTRSENGTAPLISYALSGLRYCWMPERLRYSYRLRLDIPEASNQSLPERDTFYTLNVLLGLSRLKAFEQPDGLADIYASCCGEAGDPRWRTYAYGMALWAGVSIGLEPPGHLIEAFDRIVNDHRRLASLTAQDIGMMTSGAIAMSSVDARRWKPIAQELAARLTQQYFHEPTRLFFNQATGTRRAFSSFASQVYSILALYQYGEAFAVEAPIRIASMAASRLIELQGPRGEWPWFYYVPRGQVVDFYEVYSVHQHGMAPAFLNHATVWGVEGAREALTKGFAWVFGHNEMGLNMLCPSHSVIYRSQVRGGELNAKLPRFGRSLTNALLGRADSVQNHRILVLRRECRSYELGWILWSFGGRLDYPDITGNPAFLSAVSNPGS
jgi:hypothetical protein